MDNDVELAINLATLILAREKSFPSEAMIRQAATQVISGMLPQLGSRIEEVVRLLESRYNVRIGTATELVDKSHRAWLPSRKAEIGWRYWNRYKAYLLNAKHLPVPVVDSAEESVDRILGLLADPLRAGPWDRRGLVVGHVQSGKTSNYTGLICKAVDAGYRVIVVLAGVHSSLRSQTQQRLDEGFLGFDSVAMRKQSKGPIPPIGAAVFDPSCQMPSTVTTVLADFNKAAARQFHIQPRQTLLFVVKKNASVLNNLLGWVQHSIPASMASAPRPCIPDVPLLVIDDEADHASVDTKAIPLMEDGSPDPEHNPTAINRAIRTLLHSFEKAAYVGYTATPFANIYIHERAETKEHGADLFPRSFIVNLPAPTNYVGPVRIFGLAADPDADEKAQIGLPLVRPIDDFSDWLPNGHKRDCDPGPVPDSLQKAIKAFVLVCAARRARGDVVEHNSMLIHVTRFTDVQKTIAGQIKEELKRIQQRLRHGDGDGANLRNELRELWESDFVPTTRQVAADDCPEVSWAQIESALLFAAEKIEVRIINGEAADVLDYANHSETGINVIAVGGDKLSRGLTLEGLSVSYYLRASRMYDTLMQMGRWFGYRPKYLDLCRLYTTNELVEWYEHITEANEELRELFDQMALSGADPEAFGVRVQSHPDLLVTGPVKMRNGHKLQLTFAGDISETIAFHRDSATVERNYQIADRFIRGLGDPKPEDKVGDKLVWKGVKAEKIVNDFLGEIRVHPAAYKVRPELLSKYIQQRVPAGELVNWTVVLVSVPGEESPVSLGGHSIGLVKRAPHPEGDPSQLGRYGIRRLVSPNDERIDLTDAQEQAALAQTIAAFHAGLSNADSEPTNPSGTYVRAVRDKSNGLLLIYPLNPAGKVESDKPVIGFALSFPGSNVDDKVSYVVNNVYFQQEFSFDDS